MSGGILVPPSLLVPTGACRLVYVSAAAVRLDPFAGQYLLIDRLPRRIPAAGVVLANTGLTAATFYYVYAAVSSGRMVLEASTTGHVTDAATGMEVKNGDASRTLVGMVYMGAGTPGTFQDDINRRLVASYFNRRTRSTHPGNIVNTSTTTSATATAINAADNNAILVWGDEDLSVQGAAILNNNTVNGCAFSVGADGTAETDARTQLNTGNANQQTPFSVTVNFVVSEGYHYVQGFMNSVIGGDTTTAFLSHIQAVSRI